MSSSKTTVIWLNLGQIWDQIKLTASSLNLFDSTLGCLSFLFTSSATSVSPRSTVGISSSYMFCGDLGSGLPDLLEDAPRGDLDMGRLGTSSFSFDVFFILSDAEVPASLSVLDADSLSVLDVDFLPPVSTLSCSCCPSRLSELAAVDPGRGVLSPVSGLSLVTDSESVASAHVDGRFRFHSVF